MSGSRGIDPVRLTLGEPGDLPSRIAAALGAKGARVSLEEVRGLVESGEAWTDGDPRTAPVAYLYRPIPDETTVEIPVIYEDEDLVVVDKPAGLATTPQGSFVARSVLVQARRQIDDSLAPAHRLDRATSGVLVLTRDTPRRGFYQAQFQGKLAKVYEFISGHHGTGGLLASQIRPGQGRMTQVEDEPNAWTEIEPLGPWAGRWRYRARPRTGRTHQIRLHAVLAGIPIEGDRLYQDGTVPDVIYLHSTSLTLRTPGGERTFESSPPWMT